MPLSAVLFCICYIISLHADAMYMFEVDRVLRPGGYWILSGPPINWKTNHQAWKRSKEDLEAEQNVIEKIAEMLCWGKIHEKGDTVIWRKKADSNECHNKDDHPSKMCKIQDADDVWCVLYVSSSTICVLLTSNMPYQLD